MATRSGSPDPTDRTRLSPTELDAYDHIPRHLAKRVRIWSIPALPGPFTGMTMGRHIVLGHPVDRTGGSTLLAHELVHVRQWAELGAVGFGLRYLGSFAGGVRRHHRWMSAYRDIPAEREARSEAARWKRRHLGHHERPGT